jgi:hypothetical protein
MFHVVFQARDAEVLTAAMDMDEALDGEIVLISDDYSLGPIADSFTEEGMALRKAWWRGVLGEPEPPADTVPVSEGHLKLQQILERMREEEFDRIWIWVASNARDVSGYYWLVAQLNEFAGRIDVLSLNNLPFINDKGAIFYPSFLSEIPSREFIKAKKLARPVSLSEFETDPDEWTRLAHEQRNIRILEGAKKLVQQEDDYYDAPLKKFITTEFQKTSRIINQFLSKSPVRTGEAFLLWRLKQLVSSGALEREGELLRLPGGEPVITAGFTAPGSTD